MSYDNERNYSLEAIAKFDELTNKLMPVFLLNDFKNTKAWKFEDRFSCCGQYETDPVYLPERAV